MQQENTHKEQNLWDEAIADTERKLHNVEAKARRLKAAINTYKAHRDAGIPWPGFEVSETKSPQEGG